jgi:predicted TIM-barrel fold metal-dependent hydrolase
MIKDDVLVFDCVAHPFNFDPSNALGKAGELFNNHLYAFHQVLTPESEPKLSEEEFLKEWGTDEISRMVFEESDTDMLVAMPLPLTDLFHDGLSPWERCVELTQENPDRTVFWGTVNPLEGKKALDLMEVQVKEYGAKAFKFYNVRYDYGEPFPWRMDDPKVAFPVYEKAMELGINFPDINFVIFHVGLPFIDETCWQLVRYPNLYASIAATINFVVRSPRQFAEWIGKLMFWCGEDKIIYGSETPIWHPKWALDAFWNFEIPEDLVEGYGYPQLTEGAKRKILGENLLRLQGMDVEETRRKLANA